MGPMGEIELSKQNTKPQEVLFEKKMVNMSLDKQPLPMELLAPKNGKKFLDTKKTRAL